MPSAHEPPRYRFAELHLHLGGAILPRILYTYMERETASDPESPYSCAARDVLERYPDYAAFEERVTRKTATLEEYLEAHRIIEPLQTIEALPYFIYRLLRGAYVFESVAYMELRLNPYFRIPKNTPQDQVIARMEDVVSTIATAASSAQAWFPVQFTQILCMDSRLPVDLNKAIVDVAASMPEYVCAVDLAGPNEPYEDRRADFHEMIEYAKGKGLNVTAHLFETPMGCVPELLPLVDRIGHGIQIALAHRQLLVGVANRGQCLEVCPTTYLKTGTMKTYKELKPVFERCFDLGVDVAVGTDNMALNDIRLPREHELLLLNRVLSFSDMDRCRQAAFRHAFRWDSDKG